MVYGYGKVVQKRLNTGSRKVAPPVWARSARYSPPHGELHSRQNRASRDVSWRNTHEKSRKWGYIAFHYIAARDVKSCYIVRVEHWDESGPRECGKRMLQTLLSHQTRENWKSASNDHSWKMAKNIVQKRNLGHIFPKQREVYSSAHLVLTKN